MAEQMTPSEVGAMAELAVATALTKAGHRVFVPFFNSHGRVDLIYEDQVAGIRRVQVKTARLTNGYLSFLTCSNTGGVRRAYYDEAEDFGVYCVENGLVYLVPVAEVPTRAARLRVEPTRSNQHRGIRWAEPYLVGPLW